MPGAPGGHAPAAFPFLGALQHLSAVTSLFSKNSVTPVDSVGSLCSIIRENHLLHSS